MNNKKAFEEFLALTYKELFETDPDYKHLRDGYTIHGNINTISKPSISPDDLAKKMTAGLATGAASKDGKGIKRTCKHFGISYTYKAIATFLNEA